MQKLKTLLENLTPAKIWDNAVRPALVAGIASIPGVLLYSLFTNGVSGQEKGEVALARNGAYVLEHMGRATLEECGFQGLVRDKFRIRSVDRRLKEDWTIALCSGPFQEPQFRLLQRTEIASGEPPTYSF